MHVVKTESVRFFLSNRHETLHTGTFEIKADELVLTYNGSAVQERYTFEFHRGGSLLLRTSDTLNDFRRPSDVPIDMRRTTGIKALKLAE